MLKCCIEATVAKMSQNSGGLPFDLASIPPEAIRSVMALLSAYAPQAQAAPLTQPASTSDAASQATSGSSSGLLASAPGPTLLVSSTSGEIVPPQPRPPRPHPLLFSQPAHPPLPVPALDNLLPLPRTPGAIPPQPTDRTMVPITPRIPHSSAGSTNNHVIHNFLPPAAGSSRDARVVGASLSTSQVNQERRASYQNYPSQRRRPTRSRARNITAPPVLPQHGRDVSGFESCYVHPPLPGQTGQPRLLRLAIVVYPPNVSLAAVAMCSNIVI